MKNINKLLVTAVLALCGAGSASAAIKSTSGIEYLPMNPGTPGVYNTSWSFSDMSTGASDDPFAAAHKAGGAFDDYFIFNVPEAEVISFSAKSQKQNGNWEVSFGVGNDGYAVYPFGDGPLVAIGGAKNKTPQLMKDGSWTLTSGTYVLEIAGNYAIKGGLYDGTINGIPLAVPEPSSALMLLAGLAGLAGVARLRKRKA